MRVCLGCFIPAFLLGCNASSGGGDDVFGSAGQQDAGGATASMDGSGDTPGGANGGAEAADTGEIRFDIGAPGDASGGQEGGTGEGCTKIDFVFAIDNSGSMGAHQAALIASFGPFIDTIFGTVQAQDYRIIVVDSDEDRDLSSCQPCPYDACADFCEIKDTLPACEGILGAGEIQPYNPGASNRPCGVPDGHRWLASDLPAAELKEKFACVAQVGDMGSGGELPISAAVAAVTAESAAGGCNEGFLRDDAILVVTIISDDYPSSNMDDASTVGSVDEWYNAFVTAKAGKPQNIVMLGVFNLAGSTCVQEGTAGPGPLVQPTQKFVDLVERFGDRGVIGDVCAEPDYGPLFAEAVGLIDTACDEYTPEG